MNGEHRESDHDLLSEEDPSLLDVVDHVLNKGIVVSGDIVLGIAGVDLVYLKVSALVCAADKLARKE